MRTSINPYEQAAAAEDKPFKTSRVLDNISLVKSVVRRISENLPPNIMADDLIQIGYIGLIDAARRFEGDDEKSFKAYATYRIRGQIMDELRKHDILTRVVRDRVDGLKKAINVLQHRLMRDPRPEELASHMGIGIEEYHRLTQEARTEALISIEDIIGRVTGIKRFVMDDLGTRVADPEAEVHLAEIKEILVDEIDKLTERERTVISLYYYEELTFREIGEALGVTESRVSQLHTQSILKLEKRLKSAFGTSKNPGGGHTVAHQGI